MTGRATGISRHRFLSICEHHFSHVAWADCGLGADEYARDAALRHPMACALYVRGLLALADVTGAHDWIVAAEDVGERLLEVRSPDGGWGLRFPNRGHPAGQSYAITTAHAALAFAGLARASEQSRWGTTAVDAGRWSVECLGWKGSAPWYAPGDDLLSLNVASMTAAALMRAYELEGDRRLLDRARRALAWVLAGQEQTGLWAYGPPARSRSDAGLREDCVVDLIHSSYVLDGLACSVRTARELGVRLNGHPEQALVVGLTAVLRELVGPDGRCREKVAIAGRGEPRADALLRRGHAARYLPASEWLVRIPKESRLWGYGALIGGAARISELGLCDLSIVEPVVSRATSIFASAASGRFPFRSDDPGNYPRNEAHLFEGLAAYDVAMSHSCLPSSALA